MRHWLRSHLTYANVMVTLLAFIVLTGGTAVALSGQDTVQSDDLGPGSQVQAPDVAADAVNGSDVVNGSLGLADLNATSRPHKLEFSAADAGLSPIATMGHLRVSAACEPPSVTGQRSLYVRLTNLTSQLATMNGMFGSQTASNGPVSWRGVGQFVGANDAVFLNNTDGSANTLARGNFNRVEGQVVFQTPGRVTTIVFHASTDVNGCNFYGTAVTSNLS